MSFCHCCRGGDATPEPAAGPTTAHDLPVLRTAATAETTTVPVAAGTKTNTETTTTTTAQPFDKKATTTDEMSKEDDARLKPGSRTEPASAVVPVATANPADPATATVATTDPADPESGAIFVASTSDVTSGVPGGLPLTLLVIGEVTATTARILVEMLDGGEVTCTLKRVQSNVRPSSASRQGGNESASTTASTGSDSQAPRTSDSSASKSPEVVSLMQLMVGGRPRIFAFKDLEPNARYDVYVTPLSHAQPASQFRTFMADWRIGGESPPLHLAVVSCNLLSETLALKSDQADLWSDMAARVLRDEVDMLLHMGDQVYADEPRSDSDVAPPVSAFATETHTADGAGLRPIKPEEQLVFRRALQLVEGKSCAAECEPHRAAVEALYRQLYRETWSHRPTAVVLANVPNLTVCDDHDYVDNWGQLPHGRDKDRTSLDFFVATCARQVYWEYQGSLYRDVDLARVNAVEEDHHFHVFGEFGIAFTESRGAGSFRYDPNDKTPFLGHRQWADLEEAMSPNGIFKDVKHLLIVCPCPLVYLPHTLNSMVETMVEDALGHWASKPFRDEQTRLLNLALTWQEGPDFRQRCADVEPSKVVIEDKKPYKDAKAEEKPKGVHRTDFPSVSGVAPREAVLQAAEVAKVAEVKADESKSSSSASSPPPIASVFAPPLRFSARRVTFLGGDVHVGGHTRLFYHGHHVFDQLVSSAISNHVLPSAAFAIGQLVQNASTQLADDWSFEHQQFTRHRNYGLIDSDGSTDDEASKPRVNTVIVSAE